VIASDGSLRCDGCGKKLALRLEGELEIYCPRCHYYQTIKASTAQVTSHLTNSGNSAYNINSTLINK